MIVIVFGQARAQVGDEVLLGIAAIIGSALCYAVNIVLMRHQALAAKPLEINFFQSRHGDGAVAASRSRSSALPAWPGGQWGWVGSPALLSTAGTLAVRLGLCARRRRAISR